MVCSIHLERALAVPHQDVDLAVLAAGGDVVPVTGERRGAARAGVMKIPPFQSRLETLRPVWDNIR